MFKTFTALLVSLVPFAASADRTLAHYAKACGLTGTPTSVVVDVYDDSSPGSLMATIPNGDVSRIGTTDCYLTDLAATGAPISYPAATDASEMHYTLAFRDDASNTVFETETVAGMVGLDAYEACARETPVYPTVTIPGRGITTQVIAAGKPNYFQVDIDCGLTFGSPVTFYWVFAYDSSGRVSSRTAASAPPSP